ncbi:MAG: pinensin family lanthipeptide [Acidobacteriota bacterium]|nr:pinensin family lanthipeptide [Acidobacteriota bacterium]
MKLRLEDLKVNSFVTNESVKVKAGALPPTEAANCTTPQVCGVPSRFCYTNWCPSDWTECGPTDLC